MPHPFFESGQYPWALKEASQLHKELYTHVKVATDIELIFQQCSSELEPLEREAPSRMWKAALEAIATAQLLRVLGERLKERSLLVAVNRAFDASAALPDPILLPVMSGDRIFFDREPLRTKVNQMGGPASGISVLLVRGEGKSGKTWTKHLVEDLAEAAGDESVYLASGLVATAEEALDKVFGLLRGKVPRKLTTEDAWFRKACTEMSRLAAKRGKGRYWIIADDLNNLDPLVRQFFDQAALEMQNRAFAKWFRLVLIDYPELTIPTKWKGFWTEDRPAEAEVNEVVVSKFLMDWAGHKKKLLLEAKATEFAGNVVTKTAAAVPPDQRPRLERIHDELAALLATL